MTCVRGCCESNRDHYRSIRISAVRKRMDAHREKELAKDMDAYKRMRAEGLQPPRINGSRDLEQRADHPEQIATGMTNVKPEAFERFADAFGHKATEVAP